MSMDETLGVTAHHGGLVVERPELSVGIVRAVSRTTGLELELLARRPLDRRSASERQADIRSGRAAPATAPRRRPSWSCRCRTGRRSSAPPSRYGMRR